MVFKEIRHEQLFQNLGPMAELEIEKEKPKPPNIPAVKEPSKVEKPSSTQIPITQNAMDALLAAKGNYSGDIPAYLKETNGVYYCIIPCEGGIMSKAPRKLAEYRIFDFSGTQQKDGMDLLISTEKTYADKCKTDRTDVAGSALAFGFDGIIPGYDGTTFDKLSKYMKDNHFDDINLKQALDPWGNEIPGAIRFKYTDGDQRLGIIKALSQFKIDNKIDKVGSTPEAIYATAASDMVCSWGRLLQRMRAWATTCKQTT